MLKLRGDAHTSVAIAAERKKAIKAVRKRLDTERRKKYGAKNEEATEMRTQHECILSGGVYLRHRLRKSSFSLEKSEIPEKILFLSKINRDNKY